MYNTEKLTRLTAELEGLIHVLNRRDSENIRLLIRSKYSDFTEEFDAFLEALDESEAAEALDELEKADHDAQELEVKEQEAESGEIEPEDDIASEKIAAEVEQDNKPVIMEEEPDYGFEPEINEFSNEPEVAEEKEPERQRIPYNEPEISSELKVDRMLSRKEATDLKRVFTLNDKFRFRRALFNQDDAAFGSALAQLSEIPTFEAAQKYVVDKYGWDLENPDVEDFMLIIKPHYE